MKSDPSVEVIQNKILESKCFSGGGWVDGFSPEFEMMSSPEMEEVEDISMDTSIGPEGRPPGRIKPTTTKHK